MLGINGWEFLILIVLAVVILGPERLPEYAAKLAQGVRKLRVMAEGAKVTLKDQLGPEYQDINWRHYDPRQYDPRRIVREALASPRGGRRCGDRLGGDGCGREHGSIRTCVLLGRRGHLKTQLLHDAEVGVSGRRG